MVVLMIMIMTILAFAMTGAQPTCLKAFTILFLALRFLTTATYGFLLLISGIIQIRVGFALFDFEIFSQVFVRYSICTFYAATTFGVTWETIFQAITVPLSAIIFVTIAFDFPV